MTVPIDVLQEICEYNEALLQKRCVALGLSQYHPLSQVVLTWSQYLQAENENSPSYPHFFRFHGCEGSAAERPGHLSSALVNVSISASYFHR